MSRKMGVCVVAGALALAMAGTAMAGPTTKAAAKKAAKRRPIPTLQVGPGTDGAPWSDNFDGYANGSGVIGQGGWVGWTGTAPPPDGFVDNAQSSSAPNSMRAQPGTATTSNTDAVQTFAVAGGAYTFKGMTYVPSSASGDGFWIILNTYGDPPVVLNWSVQVQFDATNNLVVSQFGNQTLALIEDAWTEIRCEINLDTDDLDIYYGGQILAENLSWANNVSGAGAATIQALDLYCNTISTMYFDDCSLQAAGGGCYPDCDGNSTLNVNDYICFQTKFALGDPYADCDNNGVRNVNDYICFQTKFALGC
jgi:hypothetical protein